MYDLIIIGGGPAGYHSALKAAESGLKTCVVEKERLGGVCLNSGCIPSKTLLYSSSLYYKACNSGFAGVSTQGAELSMEDLQVRKDEVISKLRKGIESLFKKRGIEIINAEACIKGRNNKVFTVNAGKKELSSERLLVCTGSSPFVPQIPGIEDSCVISSREALSIDYIPDSISVIGGGIIGLELATFFNEAGSDVTVIEVMPKIGSGMDQDTGKLLMGEMKKKGVKFLLETEVKSIQKRDIKVFSKKKGELSVDSSVVLVTTGRRPYIQDIGLENLGFDLSKGYIETDKYCKTSADNVWAAGDINGKSMLAHTAYMEAEICIQNILGKRSATEYDSVPSVIYTHPEAAWAGLTQKEAEERGFETEVRKSPMGSNGRFLAETGKNRGICKLVSEKGSGRILGIHIAGPYASEMIWGVSYILANKGSLSDLERCVFPHPTVSEAIKALCEQ